MANAISETIVTERRGDADRRRTGAILSGVFCLRGRRKSFRRPEDAVRHRLDHFDRRLLIPSLTILILCLLDAVATLRLLEHGATEANLIMRLLIEEGVVAFIVTKYLMTAAGLVWLVAHNNFRIFNLVKVHHVIYGCAAAYVTLLAYELALLRHLPFIVLPL